MERKLEISILKAGRDHQWSGGSVCGELELEEPGQVALYIEGSSNLRLMSCSPVRLRKSQKLTWLFSYYTGSIGILIRVCGNANPREVMNVDNISAHSVIREKWGKHS